MRAHVAAWRRGLECPSGRARNHHHELRRALASLALLLSLLLLAPLVAPPEARAWKAAGHYTIAEQVAKDLPAGAIKNAMNAQPGYWAWGSEGPDLGYGRAQTVIDRAPWADKWHYQWVGSVARRLLQVAIASGDQRKISFAAGWLTHCAGDLAVHDRLTNPEAGGVFFDNPDTKTAHRYLEEIADPYCWVALGGHPASEYEPYIPDDDNENKFYQHYDFDLDVGVRDMLNDVSQEVHGDSPGSQGIENFSEILFGMLWGDEVGASGVYHDYNDAVAQLALTQPNGLTRKANLEWAWHRSVDRSVELLSAAQGGTYSGFTDCWNLDVGERDPRTFCTLTVRVHTKAEVLAGTSDDVYFALKHDDEWLYMKPMDQPFHLDFAPGDTDDYYIYVSDPNFNPRTIKSCWLYKSPDGWLGGWRPEWMTVWANGKLVVDQAPCSRWLEGGEEARWWGVEADWSWIVPADPPPPPPPPEKPHGVAGDWDGDGCEDIAQFVADSETATSLWLYRSHDGRFEVSRPWAATSGWSLRRSKEAAGDFDADGKDELAVLYGYQGINGWDSGLLVFSLEDPAVEVTRVWTADTSWLWAATKMTAGDFDADGKDELGFLYDYDGLSGLDVGLWTFALNAPPKGITQHLWWTAPAGTFDWAKSKLTAGDYSGDGRDEFGVLYDEGGALGRDVSFRQIDVGATPVYRTDWYPPADRHIYWTRSAVTSGDIAGDGRDDMLLLYKDDLSTYAVMWWALENSAGGSNFWTYWTCPPGAWTWDSTRPFAVDPDGDGKDEAAAFYDYGGWSGVDNGLWYWPLHSMQDTDQPLYLWTKWTGDWTLGGTVEERSGYLDTKPPTLTASAPAWAWPYAVRVAWTASDEANGSGLGSCQVAARDASVGGEATWEVVREFGELGASSFTWTGALPGRRYVLRVRAQDLAGNLGVWRHADVVTPHDESQARFGKTWAIAKDAKLYLGASRSATARGATATFTYKNAKSLKLLVTRMRTGGYADVYVNGRLAKRNVSFYASGRRYRQWVVLKTFAAQTSGTVKVVVRHAKAGASKGYRVEVDGLLAL